MTHRCGKIVGASALSLVPGTAVWAQAPADPVRPADPGPLSFVLLFIPFLMLGLVMVMMRRAKKMQPKLDVSLRLAEENLKLSKEQVVLQAETNRLLTRLIEAVARE